MYTRFVGSIVIVPVQNDTNIKGTSTSTDIVSANGSSTIQVQVHSCCRFVQITNVGGFSPNSSNVG